MAEKRYCYRDEHGLVHVHARCPLHGWSRRRADTCVGQPMVRKLSPDEQEYPKHDPFLQDLRVLDEAILYTAEVYPDEPDIDATRKQCQLARSNFELYHLNRWWQLPAIIRRHR